MLHSSGSLFAHHTFLAGIKEQHGVAGSREREGRLGWWWWCKNCSRSRGTCLPSHAEVTYKKDQGEVEKEKPRNAGWESWLGWGWRCFFKLSGALMCLRPAESKERKCSCCMVGGSGGSAEGGMKRTERKKRRRRRVKERDVRIRTDGDRRRD